MDAASLITAAISRGAPRFNAGDAMGCFNLYRETASHLASVPGLVPQEAQVVLVSAIESSFGQEASAKAWTMRHALDDVLARLRGGASASDTETAPASTAAPFAFGDAVWTTVDDRVMGGSSRSTMTTRKEGTFFEGELVCQGGGFASVRCIPRAGSLGLAGARGLRLRCAGDGRVGYKITLKTDANMDGVSYQCGFDAGPGDGAVRTVTLPFAGFQASFRGRPVPNAPPLRGADVVQIGVMLSRYDVGATDDRVRAGRFQLRLVDLEGYGR